MLSKLKQAVTVYTGRNWFEDAGEPQAADLAWLLPVTGAILGAVLWLIALLLRHSTPGRPVATGLLGAVLITGIVWTVRRGRGPIALIHFTENWITKARTGDEPATYAPYWGMAALQALLLLRPLATGLIVAQGSILWVWASVIGGAVVLAGRTTAPETERTTPLSVPPAWIIGGVLVALVGAAHRNLVYPLLAFLLAVTAATAAEERLPATTERRHLLVELTEVLLLLLGILAG